MPEEEKYLGIKQASLYKSNLVSFDDGQGRKWKLYKKNRNISKPKYIKRIKGEYRLVF